ncbi:MAG: hypothetical protein QOC65_651 [Sphingomonadales bacterium]|nr:hypothetical protein [Sphingomonadales bacterium]
MGQLEIILVFVAAAIMAVNQGLGDAPRLTRRYPWLRPRGWWNYLPFLFLASAVVAYLLSWRAPEEAPARPSIASRSDPVPPSVSETVARQERPGIPLEILTMFYDHSTDTREQLFQSYDGAAVSVSGQIANIFREAGRTTVWLTPEASGRARIRTILWFRDDQIELLGRLRIGDRAASRCTFKARADQISLTLEDCVLSGGRPL